MKKLLTLLIIVAIVIVGYLLLTGGEERAEEALAPTTPPTVQAAAHPEKGAILVDATGMTLYVKANDKPSESTCYGTCAENWPPYIYEGDLVAGEDVTGSLARTPRTDGSGSQVTYKGQPLYYWIQDENAGDTKGDGFGGIWSVARP